MITSFDSPASERRDNNLSSQLVPPSRRPSPSLSFVAPSKEVSISSGGYGGRSNIGSLRYYAARVCNILAEKGSVPSSVLGDIVVGEIQANRRRRDMELMKRKTLETEAKTILRRVYDAINILEALGIIGKEKKMIIWRGVPATKKRDQQVTNLERFQETCRRHEEAIRDADRKTESLRIMLEEVATNNNLCLQNHKRQCKAPIHSLSKYRTNDMISDNTNTDDRVYLPFIVAGASRCSLVKCDMSDDCSDVTFDFSLPYIIVDGRNILSRMNIWNNRH